MTDRNVENTKRLLGALYRNCDTDTKIETLANLINYIPSQLKQDIEAGQKVKITKQD